LKGLGGTKEEEEEEVYGIIADSWVGWWLAVITEDDEEGRGMEDEGIAGAGVEIRRGLGDECVAVSSVKIRCELGGEAIAGGGVEIQRRLADKRNAGGVVEIRRGVGDEGNAGSGVNVRRGVRDEAIAGGGVQLRCGRGDDERVESTEEPRPERLGALPFLLSEFGSGLLTLRSLDLKPPIPIVPNSAWSLAEGPQPRVMCLGSTAGVSLMYFVGAALDDEGGGSRACGACVAWTCSERLRSLSSRIPYANGLRACGAVKLVMGAVGMLVDVMALVVGAVELVTGAVELVAGVVELLVPRRGMVLAFAFAENPLINPGGVWYEDPRDTPDDVLVYPRRSILEEATFASSSERNRDSSSENRFMSRAGEFVPPVADGETL
jgi:hypothetical protein